MKYYSEKLNKLFDSTDELEAEEKKLEEQKETKSRAALEKKLLESMDNVASAYANLETVKSSFVELRKEFEQELENLVKEPTEIVKKAEKERDEIAAKFKEKFGEEEYKKTLAKLIVEKDTNKVEKKQDVDDTNTLDLYNLLLGLFLL